MYFICDVKRAASALCHRKFSLTGGWKVPYDTVETRIPDYLSSSKGHFFPWEARWSMYFVSRQEVEAVP